MKRKALFSLVAIVLLVAIAGTAYAASCCPGATIYYYSINNNSRHRYVCSICGEGNYAPHTINPSTRECLRCGDILGD